MNQIEQVADWYPELDRVKAEEFAVKVLAQARAKANKEKLRIYLMFDYGCVYFEREETLSNTNDIITFVDPNMKFTFKTHARPTGLAQIGAKKNIDIKLKGKVVGAIAEESYDKWRIGFIITKSPKQLEASPNCLWKWIFISKRFANEDAARTAVNSESMAFVMSPYILFPLEP